MTMQRQRVLVVILAILLGLLIPEMVANGERLGFVCPSNASITCLSKGTNGGSCSSGSPSVKLAVKYGCLIPDQQMAFLSFGVYNNGTVFLDASGGWWGGLGSPQNIMVFQIQSYGNGSLDIRINGPAATVISTDGISTLSARGSWGQGPEIILAGASIPTDMLSVSWIPLGGTACPPICPPPSPPSLLLFLEIGFITILFGIILVVIFQRKK